MIKIVGLRSYRVNTSPKKHFYGEARAHASLAHHHPVPCLNIQLSKAPQQQIKKKLAAPCLASTLHGRSRCYPSRAFTRVHPNCYIRRGPSVHDHAFAASPAVAHHPRPRLLASLVLYRSASQALPLYIVPRLRTKREISLLHAPSLSSLVTSTPTGQWLHELSYLR